MKKEKLVALIPARQGSERLKNKNIINFYGKPLIAYTIISAIKSGIFDKIVVSTDSKKYALISKKYGAEVPFLRPKNISNSYSPDFEWVNYTIEKMKNNNEFFTHFFILRPTNPFRLPSHIKDAWNLFKLKNAQSLRAVELCKQHPGKMWILKSGLLKPILNVSINRQPSYNSQYKSLPKIYVQNASLEISKVEVLKKYKTITHKNIIPFFIKGFNAFDINYPLDIKLVDFLVKNKILKIPKI